MRIILISLFIAFLGIACSSSGSKSARTETSEVITLAEENLKVVNICVKGMTCEGCENSVVTSIRKLDGIQDAKASHIAESTIVKFDSTKTSVEAISQAITDAGYSVEAEKDQAIQE